MQPRLEDPPRTDPDGRSARWEAHRLRRRGDLLDDVITAVREHGAGVGMEQIASAAGTSKAVLYRYFTDKNELSRRVGQRVATDLVVGIRAAVAGPADDRTMLVAGVDAYLDLLEREPHLYRFVVHNRATGSGDGADYTGLINELISAVFDARLRRLGLDPEAAAPWGTAVVGAVRAVGDWWFEHPAVPREQVSNYLVALLWNGMAGAHLAPFRAEPESEPRAGATVAEVGR